jgi:hypothetical protein
LETAEVKTYEFLLLFTIGIDGAEHMALFELNYPPISLMSDP